jgi:hypothetical protein
MRTPHDTIPEHHRHGKETVPTLELPVHRHPIWSMGFKHAEVAHSICAALASLSRKL